MGGRSLDHLGKRVVKNGIGGEVRYSEVLSWLGRVELHPKHNRAIAGALYTLLRDDRSSYALNLLPQANEIALVLWSHLDPIDPTEPINDWFQFAINYPAWDLANFGCMDFRSGDSTKIPTPTVLSGRVSRALSGIMEDQSQSGTLGTYGSHESICFFASR